MLSDFFFFSVTDDNQEGTYLMPCSKTLLHCSVFAENSQKWWPTAFHGARNALKRGSQKLYKEK